MESDELVYSENLPLCVHEDKFQSSYQLSQKNYTFTSRALQLLFKKVLRSEFHHEMK